VKIDHQIGGGEVLLTTTTSSQPLCLAGMIHNNKNQDSLCRSACTAFLSFFLSFVRSFCCHESFCSIIERHCNLSPHHMYDFNLFVSCLRCFLGWGGGEVPHFLSYHQSYCPGGWAGAIHCDNLTLH
jgi:hypothetical protein